MREPDEADVARILGWLTSPSEDTGVHLAADDGGWEFLSYATLAEQVRRVARLLVEQGVGSGDTVCVLMPTSHLCLATMFAVLAAGATLTPIAPPLFGSHEQYRRHLRGVLESSQASAVVTSSGFVDAVARAAADLPEAPATIVLDGVPAHPPLIELASPAPFVLLQMTSGSTHLPRGARISWRNLTTNLAAIDGACEETGTVDDDATATWLPLYHDMGLIGGIFQAITRQRVLYLMRPDQFVRDPARWLRVAALARNTVSPSFGLAYSARRLTRKDIEGIDLSRIRTMVVGAEPINPDHLRAFTELTAAQGFSPSAFLPSYGLAEHTLLATAHRVGEPHRMVRIDKSALRHGQPVRVLAAATDCLTVESGTDWVMSVGAPIPGHHVRIAHESGLAAAEGILGEIVLSGPSVFGGYRGNPDSATRYIDGELHTGDAGFILDGRLFVLGRMGTSLKVNGRTVFAEDLDVTAAAALGVAPSRLIAAAVNESGRPGVALFVEQRARQLLAGQIAAARTAVQAQVGEDALVWFIGVPRGGLSRTSSGKPRRAHMWQQWRAGYLVGAALLSMSGPDRDPALLEKVRSLFERTRELAVIPDDATVHFEGSLAEGFGNEGSDIDLLLLVPGAGTEAVMPTVLFVDGHRVEIRVQSHDQVRQRLQRIRRAADTGSLSGITEDLLNRVQRFLRGTVLNIGPRYGELRDVVSYPELTNLLAAWWRRRAGQCLRQAAALALLDHDGEAAHWAREGVTQAMKAFLAERGEGYVEVKWLPLQVERLRARGDRDVAAPLAEYLDLDYPQTAEVGARDFVVRALALSARLGAPTATLDPAKVILRRVPGVTTWPIRSTTHVVRGKADVFVLSPECAESWRHVVFGETLADTRAASTHIALFVRYGLIALGWRGAGTIRPVAAMCDPSRPLTPAPSTRRPVITINGAIADGHIARSPLAAKPFAECAGALMLANMVLENAREDFEGAVKDGQWQVASLCGRRIVTMAVRILTSAWGVTPLPGDPVLVEGLATLIPEHPQLAATARRLVRLSVHDDDEALDARAEIDRFVSDVQAASGGEMFPSSFASPEQWRETLRYGYQWLRMAGYLEAYLELDEARDLLSSGGTQPAARAARSDSESGESA
ncbi:MAG TPA: AMP-binding protein [Mycobacterium sp.]|nr:AMP-binding protein [Mycobacterium sp.]